jgi:hypothetical protein
MRNIRLLLGTLTLGAGCERDVPHLPDSSRAAPVFFVDSSPVAPVDSSHVAAVVLEAAPEGMALPALPPLATPPGPPVPSAAAAATNPTATLTRYLAFASFRGAPAGPDSLVECPPPEGEGWEPDNYVGIVLPTVLGTSLMREDSTGMSATGRAAVTRVVVYGRGSQSWEGRLVQKRDTLNFTLLRTPAGWAVCGPAYQSPPGVEMNFAEFVVTYEDAVRTEINRAHWLQGTRPESVARHADSVISAGVARPREP